MNWSSKDRPWLSRKYTRTAPVSMRLTLSGSMKSSGFSTSNSWVLRRRTVERGASVGGVLTGGVTTRGVGIRSTGGGNGGVLTRGGGVLTGGGGGDLGGALKL